MIVERIYQQIEEKVFRKKAGISGGSGEGRGKGLRKQGWEWALK